MADTTFTATASAPVNLETTVTARDMSFTLDEPLELGGTNMGMNPVEALLGALGACKCIVVRVFSPAHGIQLRNVSVECHGTLDPDGFLGINTAAKIGFSSIHTTFHIDADNTRDEIESFLEFVETHCPVQDTLSNPALSTYELALPVTT